GGIDRHAGPRDVGPGRPDIDDGATAARLHPRERPAAGEVGAAQVGLDHPVPQGRPDILEVAPRREADAGAINEDVDLAEILLGPREGVLDLPFVADLAADGQRCRTRFTAQALGFAQLAGVPAQYDDVGTCRGEALGHALAKATTRTRYQGRLVGYSHRVQSFDLAVTTAAGHRCGAESREA